jgi:hypothetical protein
MSRTPLWFCLPLVLAGSALPAHSDDKSAPSALESDPKGWIDLFSKDLNLKHWKRVALDTKLSQRNPWHVDAKGKILQCDATGEIKEMLLYDKEFGDGIFHVEWRFRPVTEGKKDYNSGVYVRCPDNGKQWIQIQVAHVEKPPFLGDLFGDLGNMVRVVQRSDGAKRAHPPGEWNTYEITAKGKRISVWINGATTLTWKDCPFPRGHVGMQAEFFYIEFRNIKFKELP